MKFPILDKDLSNQIAYARKKVAEVIKRCDSKQRYPRNWISEDLHSALGALDGFMSVTNIDQELRK